MYIGYMGYRFAITASETGDARTNQNNNHKNSFEEMASASSTSTPSIPSRPSATSLAAVSGTGSTAPTAASASVLNAAAKGEALTQLASSPVLRALHGHPKAILTFAPLLEGHRLDGLTEGAKRCYREATRRHSFSSAAAMGAPLLAGGGGGGGGVLGGGGMQNGGSAAGAHGGVEHEEPEEEGQQLQFKDPAAAKVWAEVGRRVCWFFDVWWEGRSECVCPECMHLPLTCCSRIIHEHTHINPAQLTSSSASTLSATGSSGSSLNNTTTAAVPPLKKQASASFLALGGVPWYRVAAALQHQVCVWGRGWDGRQWDLGV